MSQINAAEAGIQRVSKHLPNVPCEEILAARLIRQIGRRLSALAEQRMSTTGLSEPEYHTLLYTFVCNQENTVAYPGELGTSLNQSPANMTRLIDGLVQRGLVNRQPDTQDRRRLGLHITPEGEVLVNKIAAESSALFHATFDAIPAVDTHELIVILKRLAAVIDAQTVSPCPDYTA